MWFLIIDFFFFEVRHILVHPVEIGGATLVILSIIGYEIISWYDEPLKKEKEKENEHGILEKGSEKEKQEEEEVEMPETGGANSGPTSITEDENSIFVKK